MHHQGAGRVCHSGNPWGSVWKPLKRKNDDCQGPYYWPTIQSDCAKYVKKCIKCQEFGPCPILSPKHSTTWYRHDCSPPEEWHYRPPQPRQRASKIYPGRDLLLYQVDRGRAPRLHLDQECSKLHMEKHCVSIQCPHTIITDNGRQFID